MPDSLNIPSRALSLEPTSPIPLSFIDQLERRGEESASRTPLRWFGYTAMLLEQAAIDNTLVAVMILDLEEIAQIRSALGDEAAEIMLRKLMLRLADVGNSKTFAVRCPGDRFLIVAGGLQKPIEAHAVASHIEWLSTGIDRHSPLTDSEGFRNDRCCFDR
jgi:GGDEF domain-containing protein